MAKDASLPNNNISREALFHNLTRMLYKGNLGVIFK